jgi:hypothetical protein
MPDNYERDPFLNRCADCVHRHNSERCKTCRHRMGGWECSPTFRPLPQAPLITCEKKSTITSQE